MVFFLLTAKINKSQQKTLSTTTYVLSCVKDSGIARLGVVKHGDGERIVHHWRYDLIHFHAYNYPITSWYHFALLHRFLPFSLTQDGYKSSAQQNSEVMEILVITSQLTSSMCNDLKTLKKENYETVFPDYLPKISPTAGLNLKIILSMPWNCLSALCIDLNSWNMHSISTWRR